MKREPNRLINEKSLYLRQHAYNPIDWYPWCEEAFERAERMDKPIFLSIGYSTCHWCHVMERESFSDEDIGKLMNETFICIKVDREERPDIDKFYMNICQLMGRNCGWPLTIIMTPDKKPFFIATYLPREERNGMMGLRELTMKVRKLWRENKDKVYEAAEHIFKMIEEVERSYEEIIEILEVDDTLLEASYRFLEYIYDNEYGGFGEQPKFPMPYYIIYLLRYGWRSRTKRANDMAIETLINMRLGGIYDHVGYGFHRYSTDRRWILPHFEKMLYDQALHIMAYIEAYQQTRNEIFRDTVEEIIWFLDRDMKAKDGGYYTAIDADIEEGEGIYYMWRYTELIDILEKDEFNTIKKIFNISREGNYLDEIRNIKTGRNILYTTKENLEEYIKSKNTLKKLYRERSRRRRPTRDNKILTDWNGLTIAALSIAYQTLRNKEYLDRAIEATEFILRNLLKKDYTLYHSHIDGEKKTRGCLNDYSFLIWGLIELYQASLNTRYLQYTLRLTEKMLEEFLDENTYLFYYNPRDSDIPIRTKEIFDTTIPSGSGIAAYNLARLGYMTGETKYIDISEKILKKMRSEMERMPSSYISLYLALDYLTGPKKEIIIVGERDTIDTLRMIESVYSVYNPYKILLFKDPRDKKIIKISKYIKEYNMIDGKTTAYICSNFTCLKPTTDPEELKKYLQ